MEMQGTWAMSEEPGGAVFEATVAESRGVRLWSEGDSEETAAKRAVGFITLLLLPDPGLDEAIENLWEVWNFHSERAALGPPAHPQSELGQGKVVESIERPLLVVED
jgi:hypothetical protein